MTPTPNQPAVNPPVRSTSCPTITGPSANPKYIPVATSPEATPILSREIAETMPELMTTLAARGSAAWTATPTHMSQCCCSVSARISRTRPTIPPRVMTWIRGAGRPSRPVTRPQPIRLRIPITPITPSNRPATVIVYPIARTANRDA